jgi:hypothetical protein
VKSSQQRKRKNSNEKYLQQTNFRRAFTALAQGNGNSQPSGQGGTLTSQIMTNGAFAPVSRPVSRGQDACDRTAQRRSKYLEYTPESASGLFVIFSSIKLIPNSAISIA